MKRIFYASKFGHDLKLAQKRRKDIDKLKNVMAVLVEAQILSDKYQDHPLRGKFAGYRECHIEPDWLLIYKVSSSEIYFVRTGTHSDLFG